MDFINKKYDRKANRNKVHFCFRYFGRFICCNNSEQPSVIYKQMIVVIIGIYVTTLVYESIKYLHDTVNKFEVLEQLEVKAAEYSTKLDESGGATGEQLENKSPWKVFLG